MKKLIFVLIVIFAVLSCALVGCAETPNEITLYVPDGAPALAVANIASSKHIGATAVQTVITTGEDVVAKCASGEADVAILPTNAAVTICNKRNDYLIFTVNVHGLLYVVGTQQIEDITQLSGDVLSIGLANTPEYVMKTVLDYHGVNYSAGGSVTLTYKADATEIIQTILPAAAKGEGKFAVLGEPAVTNLLNKAAQQGLAMYRLFDLQLLWKQATASQTDGYPQASMIVKKDLLHNKSFAESLQQLVFSNDRFLQENLASLNELLRSAGSNLDVNYTSEIIKNCNVKAVFARDLQTELNVYLQNFPGLTDYLPLSQDIFCE